MVLEVRKVVTLERVGSKWNGPGGSSWAYWYHHLLSIYLSIKLLIYIKLYIYNFCTFLTMLYTNKRFTLRKWQTRTAWNFTNCIRYAEVVCCHYHNFLSKFSYGERKKENPSVLAHLWPITLQLFDILIGKYDDLMTRSVTSGPTLFQSLLNRREKVGRKMSQ